MFDVENEDNLFWSKYVIFRIYSQTCQNDGLLNVILAIFTKL